MEFKIGDVVQLKSGGPAMTISDVGDRNGVETSVSCYWFADTEVKYYNFVFGVLKIYEEPKAIPKGGPLGAA